LNTKSKIDVNYTKTQRSINLVYGEALFDVAKDAERPFVVQTDQGAVRAVGTVFSVRLVNDEVAVLVEEGIVELMAQPVASETLSASDSKEMVVLARLAMLANWRNIQGWRNRSFFRCYDPRIWSERGAFAR